MANVYKGLLVDVDRLVYVVGDLLAACRLFISVLVTFLYEAVNLLEGTEIPIVLV